MLNCNIFIIFLNTFFYFMNLASGLICIIDFLYGVFAIELFRNNSGLIFIGTAMFCHILIFLYSAVI